MRKGKKNLRLQTIPPMHLISNPYYFFHTIYCDEISLSTSELKEIFGLECLNKYMLDAQRSEFSYFLHKVTLPRLTDGDNLHLRFVLEYSTTNNCTAKLNIEPIECEWDATSSVPMWASRPGLRGASAARVFNDSRIELSFQYARLSSANLFFRLSFENGASLVLQLIFDPLNLYISPIYKNSAVCLSAPVRVDSEMGILEIINLKKFSNIRIEGVYDKQTQLCFSEAGHDVYVYFPFLPRVPGNYESVVIVRYVQDGSLKEYQFTVCGRGYDDGSPPLIRDILPEDYTAGILPEAEVIPKELRLNVYDQETILYKIDVSNESDSVKRLLHFHHPLFRFEETEVIIRPKETSAMYIKLLRVRKGLAGRIFAPLEFEDYKESTAESVNRAKPHVSVIGRYTKSRYNQIILNPLGCKSLSREMDACNHFKPQRTLIWLDIFIHRVEE